MTTTTVNTSFLKVQQLHGLSCPDKVARRRKKKRKEKKTTLKGYMEVLSCWGTCLQYKCSLIFDRYQTLSQLCIFTKLKLIDSLLDSKNMELLVPFFF